MMRFSTGGPLAKSSPPANYSWLALGQLQIVLRKPIEKLCLFDPKVIFGPSCPNMGLKFARFTKRGPHAVALASYTEDDKITKNTVGFTRKDIWSD